MIYPKYYIGPMSKNIVDACVEFSNEQDIKLGFIPSRRQIDYNSGYVNNWTTCSFKKYIDSQIWKNILLERDHSGAAQGAVEDEGYDSLYHDCINNINIIHIDPWKKYNSYEEGLKASVRMIKFCHTTNPLTLYEVSTEEAIQPFSAPELDRFISDLKLILPEHLFNKIIYVVIQSGTSLKGTTQTGRYNQSKLIEMIAVAKKHGLMTKEHNGDYIDTSVNNIKFGLGLDAINIAPEFGVIETDTYLELINNLSTEPKSRLLADFYMLCFNSDKWQKWVGKDFLPEYNKLELIRICGHYVFSDFRNILNRNILITHLDGRIKRNIKSKLKELHGIA